MTRRTAIWFAFTGWATAAILSWVTWMNSRTIQMLKDSVDLNLRTIQRMEERMRGNDRVEAIKYVQQYALTRARLWLQQWVPGSLYWPTGGGPLAMNREHEGLMLVIQGWQWENQALALQLRMPCLGEVDQALWFVPTGMDSKGLIEYAHPLLYRVMRATEWHDAEQEIGRLLNAATATLAPSPGPGVSAPGATITSGSGISTRL